MRTYIIWICAYRVISTWIYAGSTWILGNKQIGPKLLLDGLLEPEFHQEFIFFVAELEFHHPISSTWIFGVIQIVSKIFWKGLLEPDFHREFDFPKLKYKKLYTPVAIIWEKTSNTTKMTFQCSSNLCNRNLDLQNRTKSLAFLKDPRKSNTANQNKFKI